MLHCFVTIDRADAALANGTMAKIRIHSDTDDEFVHLEVRPEDARPTISFVLTAHEARQIARLLLAGGDIAGVNED